MFQNLSRREFIKKMAAGSLSASLLLKTLEQTLSADRKYVRQQMVWLRGQSSGIHMAGVWGLPDTLSFFTKYFEITPVNQELFNSVTDVLDKDKPHILILDGYFPASYDAPLNNLLKDLIIMSRVVILLGNEASYSSPPPEGFMDLESELLHRVETPFFRLPGAPVPARHLLGALNHLIFYDIPDLDELKRPLMFHSEEICERCHYRSDFEAGRFVRHFGEREGCLYLLGCKGPVTKNSCALEKWNGVSSWCVGAGSPCSGCSEPGYPHHHGLGRYGQLSAGKSAVGSYILRHSDLLAQGILGVTGAGIVIHGLSKRNSKTFDIGTLTDVDDGDEE